MKMQLSRRVSRFFFLAPVLIACFAHGQTFTNLHTFGSANDGRMPGAIIISDGVIYGATISGGTNGTGSIFRMNVDGSSYSNLYSFSAGATNVDGAKPGFNGLSPLVLSGGTLFGTAYEGGTNGKGTIFRVNTDGTGFTNLHTFAGLGGGSNPNSGLLLSGTTLYGTTLGGTDGDNGTVFRMDVNGSNFVTLYDFTPALSPAFTNSDGATPIGGLSFYGDSLIGTTALGGPGVYGTVFQMGTNGGTPTPLHQFSKFQTGTNIDGAEPQADLTVANGFIYGTTSIGGLYTQGSFPIGSGVIFRLAADGSDFTVLHYFSAAKTKVNGFYPNPDGTGPGCRLLLSGHTLFGTASGGGAAGTGCIFGLNTNGQDFVTYHSFETAYTNNFTGLTNQDGYAPDAGLVLYDGKFYGTAAAGGRFGFGTIFSITLPQPVLSIAASGTNAVLSWPTNYVGFSLQSKADLLPTSVWTDLNASVINTNTANIVETPMTGWQMLYRLTQ